MRGRTILFVALFIAGSVAAQDSLYTRKVLKFLCSENCYGRGYVKAGLAVAEKFLINEIKKTSASPLFEKSFTQSFYHPVNTFPSKFEVRLNGKKLQPGIDFIPSASCPDVSGKFKLLKADSFTYVGEDKGLRVAVIKKKKLTYTVARDVEQSAILELDEKMFSEEPTELKVKIKNRFINDFESRNVACFVNGTSSNDTMVIFSAHYDHLGGLGRKTYFPGANDNASGVSMVLNLLRYYTSNAPKYKTVFIFFAAEEAGLLGSKYFVESNVIDLKKIKFLINLDLLGTGDEGIMIVNGAIYNKEFERLTQLNSEKLLLTQIKKRGKAANSDHYWFTEKGVPAFFIYTMGGVTAYHDVKDVESTLPLTKYKETFELMKLFISGL